MHSPPLSAVILVASELPPGSRADPGSQEINALSAVECRDFGLRSCPQDPPEILEAAPKPPKSRHSTTESALISWVPADGGECIDFLGPTRAFGIVLCCEKGHKSCIFWIAEYMSQLWSGWFASISWLCGTGLTPIVFPMPRCSCLHVQLPLPLRFVSKTSFVPILPFRTSCFRFVGKRQSFGTAKCTKALAFVSKDQTQKGPRELRSARSGSGSTEPRDERPIYEDNSMAGRE